MCQVLLFKQGENGTHIAHTVCAWTSHLGLCPLPDFPFISSDFFEQRLRRLPLAVFIRVMHHTVQTIWCFCLTVLCNQQERQSPLAPTDEGRISLRLPLPLTSSIIPTPPSQAHSPAQTTCNFFI